MNAFENVSVVKSANIYFDGKVTSRTVLFDNGDKKTLGIMLPGEYQFNTAQAEIMEIYSGAVEVLLPGTDKWRTIVGGDRFSVPANASFRIVVREITDYCCSFVA